MDNNIPNIHIILPGDLLGQLDQLRVFSRVNSHPPGHRCDQPDQAQNLVLSQKPKG
jgi:hypothetical protein